MDRVEDAAKNLKFTAAGELVLALLKFASRRVFVVLLGKEYLGINGLFTDILSLLSLAELGVGVSITYSLYGPAARGDTETIKSLMRLYRRAYQWIGMGVLAAGLSLAPFLTFFVKEMPENVSNITLIYVLNVANTGVSYFFTYKATLLFVYQKKYIGAMIRAAVNVLAVAAQTAALFLTGNYLYYLFIAIGATFIQNAAISMETDRLYPYLREKEIRPLPAKTVKEIRRNVGAMMLHRLGSALVFGTDNLLISKFAGVAITGLYSNYTMIRNFLNIMIGALFDILTPAMGNLTATETQKHRQAAFGRLNFFSAWLFGWMSICLFCLYDPFIDIWLGGGYLLPRPAVVLIVVNFYMNSMRIPVVNTKSVLGLFWDDRFKPIPEAVLNLVISVALVKRWGITGVLAGTFVSITALSFWIDPLVLYRHGLKLGVGNYFTRYFLYAAVTIAAGLLTGALCQTTDGTVFGFFLKTVFCLLVPNVVYLAAYCQTSEFRFLIHMAGTSLHRS
ncbi:MAG: hypothetical protein HFE84_12010 [Lachnospiraceae bacterium]|nr:hypothetical protein [Lachnospiraceae bacterium]